MVHKHVWFCERDENDDNITHGFLSFCLQARSFLCSLPNRFFVFVFSIITHALNNSANKIRISFPLKTCNRKKNKSCRSLFLLLSQTVKDKCKIVGMKLWKECRITVFIAFN